MVCPIISLLLCFLCLAEDEIAYAMEKNNQIHRNHIFQGEHDRQGEAFCHVEFCKVTELCVSSHKVRVIQSPASQNRVLGRTVNVVLLVRVTSGICRSWYSGVVV